MSKKFLVAGSVNGQFDYLNSKVKQLLTKGNYEFMICVGSVLSLDFQIYEYKNGSKKFPIKTYFIDCSELSQCLNQQFPEFTEICPNFYFLGRSGILEIEGLKIAFINGIQSNKFYEFYTEMHSHKVGFSGPYFTLQDIQNIENQIPKHDFNGVDIFLSCQYPLYFDKGIKHEIKVQNPSFHIAELAMKLNPRYHFVSSSEQFFQRQPYINQKKIMSRLIGLADVGSKQKFLSAYQITPLSQMTKEELLTYSDDTTVCPYSSLNFKAVKKPNINNEIQAEEQYLEKEEDRFEKKYEEEEEKDKPLTENQTLYVQGFDKQTRSDDIQEFLLRWGALEDIEIVYDEFNRRHLGYGFVKYKNLSVTQSALKESGVYSLDGKKIYFSLKNQGSVEGGRQDANCWFCINSSALDKSLMFYEGKYVYLALDKGPITDMHFLIIPKDHVSSYLQMDPAAQQEMQELKTQMQTIIITNWGKSLICFERNMRLSNNIAHMIFHVLLCVPIEQPKLQNFKLNFEKGVKAHKIQFFKLDQKEEIHNFVSKTEFYFYLEQNSPGNKDRYLYVIDERKLFPLDFGRLIICEVFKINRQNWKECQIDQHQIKQQIQQLQFQLQKV